jgi:hypothetical protein
VTGVWEQFKGKLPFFGLIAFVPFLLGVVTAFDGGLGLILVILGLVAFVALIALMAAIWIVPGLIRAFRGARPIDPEVVDILGPLLTFAMALLALPLLWSGQHIGDLARLAINHEHYETIIAQSRVEPKTALFEEQDGVTYSVDLGPPIRVAFNPAGFLDNWSGIIFDPTGEVMQADGFDSVTGKFAASERITGLFGGDLVDCRHLWGSYYKCSFT